MTYSVTRKQITDAALSMQNVKFRHQGRSVETGADCIGYLKLIALKIKYPHVTDTLYYKRQPNAEELKRYLLLNLDEIPLADAGEGDIFLMRMDAGEPRHVSLKLDENRIIHSLGTAQKGGVMISKIRDYAASQYVAAFRIRGLID